MRILVTGGSGILGHYVIDELQRAGHAVVNADVVRVDSKLAHSGNVGRLASADAAAALAAKWQNVAFQQVDITDYGAVVSAMEGADAVISLASRPTPFNYTEEDIFTTNTSAVWNVCRAAEQLGVRRVVLASSYNAIGAQATAMARWGEREIKPPEYFPLDAAASSRAEDPYSISKWVGEQVADGFSRRAPDMSIASLRFTGVWDSAYLATLRDKPITDAWYRCQGFWSYVNILDAARACLAAAEAGEWRAHIKLFISANDTMLGIPTEQALSEVYPDVPRKKKFGEYEGVFDIAAADKYIGWKPALSWRDIN